MSMGIASSNQTNDSLAGDSCSILEEDKDSGIQELSEDINSYFNE